jgi:hypothetical protein
MIRWWLNLIRLEWTDRRGAYRPWYKQDWAQGKPREKETK